MTVFDIDPRLALPCGFVSHFLCAVTNVAVTPAVEPLDVIVGCNTFEGVAASHRCAIYFVGISEVKLRQQNGVSRSRYSRGCVHVTVSTGRPLCIAGLAAVSASAQ